MNSIDVLVPHFNSPDELAGSLETVRDQTWTGSFRVVVVDDGSTHELAKQAERVTKDFEGDKLSTVFLANNENRGRPYTRNRLLDAIEADFVSWLDAGDYWYPEKTALQFERFEELKAKDIDVSSVWLTCDYDWRWLGQNAKPTLQATEGDQLRALLEGEALRAYLWTTIQPTASLRALGPFDEQLPRLQDLDYFIRFVQAGGKLAKPSYLKVMPLCRYEKSDVGRDAAEIRRCNQRIFEKHRSSYYRYGAEFIRSAKVKADLLSARFSRNNQDYPKAIFFSGRAALRDPVSTFQRYLKWGGIR